MELQFTSSLADGYNASQQKIRVLSEHWVKSQVYCPGCGNGTLDRYNNNRPVADFICRFCGEQFELKSQREKFGPRIVDGAYSTMIKRITGDQNPNFFLLAYDGARLSVTDLVIIPKQFFTPKIIECRKPLAESARRKGWIGCNINLGGVPASGRIAIVAKGAVVPKSHVINSWRHTLFLRNQANIDAKGWLLSVMGLIDRVGQPTFTLNDLYQLESDVRSTYPENRHVRAKIRQQLQVLRDKGYLEFTGRGTYSLTN